MYLKILFLYFSLIFSTHALNFGLNTSVTTLAVADTAQTVTATETRAFDFVIQNPASNIISIFVGDSDVTTTGVNKGVEITPGQLFTLSSVGILLSSSKIFIVSTGTSIPVIIGTMGR